MLKEMNEASLQEQTSEGFRHYVTPYGRFPSVTSILGATKSFEKSEGLRLWRERVGNAEADRILKRSIQRGSDLHDNIERYLEDVPLDFKHLITKYLFDRIKPWLDRIDPYVCEIPLYSAKLRTAGRCDCVGLYEGVLSIIDFKNSRILKNEEFAHDYFCQGAAYSYMLYEMTGLEVFQIVVLISNESDPPTIFKKDMRDYFEEVMERFTRYHRNVEQVGFQSAS